MTITQTQTEKTYNYYYRTLVALAALTLVASLLVLSAAKPAHATKNFLVNSTTDDADFDLTDGRCDAEPPSNPLTRCTLRAAIQQANTEPQADAIFFNIPGTGVHTITPSSPLPSITDPVTIDGYTQGDFTTDPADDAKPNTLSKGTNAVLKIELDGENAGFGAAGLFVQTSGSVVKGLAINRFSSAGIVVAGPLNRIEGNFIGTDPSGTKALGNGLSGVDVEAVFGDETSDNHIGGTTPETRNLISGNEGAGVRFFGELAGNNDVQGNLIGTKKDGTTALGNHSEGVGIFGASFIPVGGLTRGSANTIAFNGLGGVLVDDGGASTANNDYVLRNSIFSNSGLGIDLGTDGPTPNDARDPDEGPNALQNKPVLTSAKTVSGITTIKGDLNSARNLHFLVQFYSNPSGNEGKKFIGQKEVLTDRSGNVTFAFKPKKKVAVGQKITATATSFELPFGGVETSEFSAPKKVAAS